jgi:hypothetical protein
MAIACGALTVWRSSAARELDVLMPNIVASAPPGNKQYLKLESNVEKGNKNRKRCSQNRGTLKGGKIPRKWYEKKEGQLSACDRKPNFRREGFDMMKRRPQFPSDAIKGKQGRKHEPMDRPASHFIQGKCIIALTAADRRWFHPWFCRESHAGVKADFLQYTSHQRRAQHAATRWLQGLSGGEEQMRSVQKCEPKKHKRDLAGIQVCSLKVHARTVTRSI